MTNDVCKEMSVRNCVEVLNSRKEKKKTTTTATTKKNRYNQSGDRCVDTHLSETTCHPVNS